LTFYPSKEVAPPLTRIEKNFFEMGHAEYQKKRTFALISKICRKKYGEKNFTEELIF
jgi:hypothetical protein